MTFGPRIQIRKFGRILAVFIITVLLVTGLFLAQSKLFEIREIVVVGAGVTLTLDENKTAKNLLFFPVQKVRMTLLAQNALLADVRFIKKYPHTLLVEPVLRQPVAILTTQTQMVPLDKTGIVLPETQQQTLPVLIFDIGTVHEGQKVNDPRILQSLRFVDLMPDPWIVISVTTQDGSSLVARIDESDILFTQDAQIPTLTSTLQTLLAGFRIKGSLPKSIDLRFDKPVVLF